MFSVMEQEYLHISEVKSFQIFMYKQKMFLRRRGYPRYTTCMTNGYIPGATRQFKFDPDT